MKYKLVDTNEVTIEVTPRHAGNFGYISIGGQERTPEAEYRLAEQIEQDIKRHVDDIQWTQINQKKMYEDEYGNTYDSLYEMLEDHYGDAFCSYYKFRYEDSSGIGTNGSTPDFRRLVEYAYHYGENNFTYDGVTDEQGVFIENVIAAKKNGEIKQAR